MNRRLPLRPLLLAAFVASLFAAAGSGPVAAEEGWLQLQVGAPGVYAVDPADAADVLGVPRGSVGAWSLKHRGEALPSWRLDAGGADERLVFVLPTARFAPPFRREGSPTVVLQLFPSSAGGSRKIGWAVSASAAGAASLGADERPAPAPAVIERVRRFEEDLARAPLDRAAAAAGVDGWWYWKMISHQASSVLEVDLGDLADRATGAAFPASIRLGLLGWSDPRLPEGMADHEVGVRLGGETIGQVAWDGRRRFEAEIPWPSSFAPSGPDLRLELKIPPRRTPDGETIVDLVYVDWVEVRYPVDRPAADASAPLLLRPSAEPRRLVAAEASDAALALTSDGELLKRHPEGGWIVPAGEEASELWIAEPSDLLSPAAPVVPEPATPGARKVPPGLDYLMLAPRDLVPATERLAGFHRGRGLRVAVVDVATVYDAYGWGEEGPDAVRRFLDHQLERSPDLKFVLLVGDADWLVAGAAPAAADRPPGRNLLPTFVEPSSYGPAPSDHFYAAATGDEAVPRFAVGRLPVADADELEAVTDKILAHVAARSGEARGEPPTLLMLSDATEGSLRRRDKLSESLAGAGFALRRPDRGSGPPDEAVIDALAASPSVVLFGGHGSRFQWQLGESAVGGAESHFDLDDVGRLSASERWPVVLSISCATAPFDHPTAGSLGEAFVLAPRRGAIAFLGSGVRLFTPRVFSEELVRALAREATLGEAVVAAKRAANREHVSRLYNLLGDPALPLRSPPQR